MDRVRLQIPLYFKAITECYMFEGPAVGGRALPLAGRHDLSPPFSGPMTVVCQPAWEAALRIADRFGVQAIDQWPVANNGIGFHDGDVGWLLQKAVIYLKASLHKANILVTHEILSNFSNLSTPSAAP